MNLLLATAEAEPFAKTGGLGDVMGGLPVALGEKGMKACVIMPKYSTIPQEYVDQMKYITSFYFPLGWRQVYCGIFELALDKHKVFFIDNEYYFKRENMYGYDDDIERFAFFSKAVLECAQIVGFKPDVIHCNDWHVAVIPVLLDAYYRRNPFFSNVKTVMTVHNLKFQGRCNHIAAFEMLSLGDYYFTSDKLEFKKDANFLKAGLVYADYITTVSESYAEEIKTAYYGEYLNGLLFARRDSLKGIVNGVNYDVYNPETDKMIFENYSNKNFVSGKKTNKTELQKRLGLIENPNIPMIGIVSRLTSQKGFELFAPVLDEIMSTGAQLVIVGTGEIKYENMFKYYAWKYPLQMSACICFCDELAHKVYAAADMFLMPSQFEPCGLSQLIAFKYGTLPIVREVGGLKDTVNPYNEFSGEGNGFGFKNYNAHEMLFTIQHAVDLYKKNKKAWNKMVREAMKQDYSWEVSAGKYIQMFRDICGIKI